jgi:hypothetical protein
MAAVWNPEPETESSRGALDSFPPTGATVPMNSRLVGQRKSGTSSFRSRPLRAQGRSSTSGGRFLYGAAVCAGLLGTLTACDGGTGPDPLVPTAIELTFANDSLFRGDSLFVAATVRNALGDVLPEAQLSWASSDAQVAKVDEVGKVLGLSGGRARITATTSNIAGTAELTVVGPGTTGSANGSAVVTRAGGQVVATLPGGGTLALAIPAGALDSAVTVFLEPTAPRIGAQASFKLSPPGERLNRPATLVVRVSAGARVRPTTVLAFEQNGLRVPMPSVPNPAAGTVTVTLDVLGLPASSSGTAAFLRAFDEAAAVLPGGEGLLLDLTADQMIDDAVAALDQLNRLGTFAAAGAMLLSMQAVLQAGGQSSSRFAPLASGWRSRVCGERDFAKSALSSFNFSSDYAGLERVIGGVLGWGREEADMQETLQVAALPGCLGTPVDPEALVRDKLASIETTIRNDLNAFTLTPSPRDSTFLADRVGPLLNLAAGLEGAGFDQSAETVVGILVGQFIRLRLTAYTECRAGQRQDIHSRLIRIEAAGGVGAGVSPYEVADVENDIELCGMPIRWRLLDSAGARTSEGNLGGGDSPGTVTATGTAAITGAGDLEIVGPLNALLCPTSVSANSEQFEVVAGANLQTLGRVAILTPSNQNTYLAASSLKVSIATLRTAGGIGSNGSGTVRVVFRRIGGTCSGLFANLAHSPLGSLTIQVGATIEPPTISGSLSDGTVGASYSGQLTATGGDGATFQWSIASGALPAGLALNTSTGAVTGTPTSAGSFSFDVAVSSGGRSAQAAFTVVIAATPITVGSVYVGTRRFQGTGTPFPAAIIFSTTRTRAIFCTSPNGTTPSDESRQCGALGAPFANDSGALSYEVTFAGGSFTGQQVGSPGHRISGTISGTVLSGRQDFTNGLFVTFTLQHR